MRSRVCDRSFEERATGPLTLVIFMYGELADVELIVVPFGTEKSARPIEGIDSHP
jgi:hypothetical protein